jgi:DNA-directed RNA polymerase subunit RPC12/RpoP
MPPLLVEKLSDEFGQYMLLLKCSACGHERKTNPKTLAGLFGWDMKLDDVARRLRCSKCGKRECAARAVPTQKPRGYTSLPR